MKLPLDSSVEISHQHSRNKHVGTKVERTLKFVDIILEISLIFVECLLCCSLCANVKTALPHLIFTKTLEGRY